MKYSDQQRISKIYENVNRLINYISENNVNRESLLQEYSLQWLVTTPLYNIGEHVYNLSKEYKEKHKDVQAMAQEVNVSKRTIEREIKKLRDNGRITCEGGNRHGRWRVKE